MYILYKWMNVQCEGMNKINNVHVNEQVNEWITFYLALTLEKNIKLKRSLNVWVGGRLDSSHLLVAAAELGKTHWSTLPARDFSSILVTALKLLADWLRLPFHLTCQGGQFPQSKQPPPPSSYYFILSFETCGGPNNSLTKSESLRLYLHQIRNHCLHLADFYIQS